MADLSESNQWEPGIYQLETSDPVLGGPEGIDNKQAKQLANRTQWLKDQIQKILDGVTTIGKAAQLATARTLRFKGAATGSGTYDGSADTEITLALVDSGVVAGTYTKITLNAKGIATGGSNPTVLADYGVTFASQVDAETGADTNKPMSALRVFQAIAKVVVQATEAALGWAKVATQAQTNAGTDDSTIVTPKKLRWGFQILKATNGYIVFPSWLGSFVIQWGRVAFAGPSTQTVNYPIPFPGNAMIGVCSFADSVIYAWSNTPVASIALNSPSSMVMQSGYSTASSICYLVVGY